MSNQKNADEHADLPVPALVEHRSCDFLHDRMIIKINVTMPASPEAISSTVDSIMEKVRENECAAGKEFDIEIALREALANAIKHGCKGDPSKQVQCCVACEEGGGMLIIVRDPGQGFDPLAIPDCTMGENLYENHGRGIYLINELMDEVEFKHNGTEIHMRKY